MALGGGMSMGGGMAMGGGGGGGMSPMQPGMMKPQASMAPRPSGLGDGRMTGSIGSIATTPFSAAAQIQEEKKSAFGNLMNDFQTKF